MWRIPLLLLALVSQVATACRNEPMHLHREHAALVARARGIVLVKVDKGAVPASCRFAWSAP
ncbi:MAG TPA: hypothetical protein VGC21_25000 [Telluria sp.]|jgi:hypothetical protein